MNEFDTPESAEDPVATPWAPPAEQGAIASDAAAFDDTETVATGDAGDAGETVDVDSPIETGTKKRSLRRTLVFAGAATAVGLAIGTAVGVAADGHGTPKESSAVSADSNDVAQNVTSRRDPAPSGGEVRSRHDGEGSRRGPGGPQGDRHGGRGGDRQGMGSQSANGPVGAQPGQSPSSASHGS